MSFFETMCRLFLFISEGTGQKLSGKMQRLSPVDCEKRPFKLRISSFGLQNEGKSGKKQENQRTDPVLFFYLKIDYHNTREVATHKSETR